MLPEELRHRLTTGQVTVFDACGAGGQASKEHTLLAQKFNVRIYASRFPKLSIRKPAGGGTWRPAVVHSCRQACRSVSQELKRCTTDAINSIARASSRSDGRAFTRHHASRCVIHGRGRIGQEKKHGQ